MKVDPFSNLKKYFIFVLVASALLCFAPGVIISQMESALDIKLVLTVFSYALAALCLALCLMLVVAGVQLSKVLNSTQRKSGGGGSSKKGGQSALVKKIRLVSGVSGACLLVQSVLW